MPARAAKNGQSAKNGKFSSALKRIGYTFLFILIGMIIGTAILYFVVIQPQQKQMEGLNNNINSINMALSANQAASLQKGEALAACTSELADKQGELDLAKKVSYASVLMYEASSAQQALLSGDPSSAGTRLSLAQNYLTKLKPLLKDQADLQGLETPLNEAITSYKTDSTKAVTRLDALIKTLHQLIENLLSK